MLVGQTTRLKNHFQGPRISDLQKKTKIETVLLLKKCMKKMCLLIMHNKHTFSATFNSLKVWRVEGFWFVFDLDVACNICLNIAELRFCILYRNFWRKKSNMKILVLTFLKKVKFWSIFRPSTLKTENFFTKL